jgi:hypothetical protein
MTFVNVTTLVFLVLVLGIGAFVLKYLVAELNQHSPLEALRKLQKEYDALKKEHAQFEQLKVEINLKRLTPNEVAEALRKSRIIGDEEYTGQPS